MRDTELKRKKETNARLRKMPNHQYVRVYVKLEREGGSVGFFMCDSGGTQVLCAHHNLIVFVQKPATP